MLFIWLIVSALTVDFAKKLFYKYVKRDKNREMWVVVLKN